ncbi:unnamed protein product, partial [Schistosoma turkestanicum]
TVSEPSVVAMDIDQTPTKVTEDSKLSSSSGTLAAAAAAAFSSSSVPTSADLDVMYDAEFLESVLQSLPGVDTQNEDVRKAINALTKSQSQGNSSKDDDDKKDDKHE